MFVFCLTAASGTTVLLDYIANIIWNIDIPPMINKSLYVSLIVHSYFHWHVHSILIIFVPTEVVCFWTLQSAASAARRSHDTTTAADVGGATLWPPASSSAAVACLRRRYRASGRRRRRRNPATAADVGGASYHLRPMGCRLAQRRRDGCPVAPTR